MKMFSINQIIVFLIAAVILSNCEKTVNSTLCGDDLLPGLDKLSYSVDVTQLDLIPEDPEALNGFKSPIFEYTCEKGKKWKNAYNNVTYSVPDQIIQVVMIPSGSLDAETKIYNTASDVQKSLAVSVGLDINVPLFGAFSASTSYKRSQDTFNKQKEFVSSADASVAGFRADVVHFWEKPFSQDILDYIEHELPENYSTDPKKYQQFVDIYGTHYFSAGTFGGKLRLEIVTSSDLRKTMKDEDISVNVEASYMSFLKVKGAVDKTDRQVDQAFSSASHNKSYYYGGKANLLDQDNSWKSWWDTVASNPWLFGGQLAPIDDVLPEDDPKKIAIQLAVKSHLITKGLPNYFSRLDNFIRQNKAGLERAHDLQSELTNLMAQTPVEPIAAQELLADIEAYINPPKEWLENTRLCYGCPSDACSDKVSVCSAVNKYEAAQAANLFDFVGYSGSIGLFSTPPLPWLNNVSICFATITSPNSTYFKMCAHPNAYSPDISTDPSFTNETKVVTYGVNINFDPRQVPGWFLNSRLCLDLEGFRTGCSITLFEARKNENDKMFIPYNSKAQIGLETDSF